MASLDSVLTRQALAKGIARRKADDEAVGIRLYPLAAAGAVTSVTVDNTTEDFEFITAGGGTDTYTVAAYATIGALVDAINKDGAFDARVVDALRSDSTDDTFVDGAVTVGTDEFGTVCYNLLLDTSANTHMDVVISPLMGVAPIKGHRVHLQEIQYAVNVGTAAADSVQVYLRKGASERKVWSATSVDTTATTLTFASGQGKITGDPDEEIIVRVKDAASVTGWVQAVGIYE